ncbi:MAG: hypothetical protein IPG45_00110 [Deltaproteobacteria bacterium]|nr:hypothetical protein [Deltaproteobacteria bacterium]
MVHGQLDHVEAPPLVRALLPDAERARNLVEDVAELLAQLLLVVAEERGLRAGVEQRLDLLALVAGDEGFLPLGAARELFEVTLEELVEVLFRERAIPVAHLLAQVEHLERLGLGALGAEAHELAARR